MIFTHPCLPRAVSPHSSEAKMKQKWPSKSHFSTEMKLFSTTRSFQNLSLLPSCHPNFQPFSSICFQFTACNHKPKFASRPRTMATQISITDEQIAAKTAESVPDSSMKLLFVEMGVGYDQHGQDITSAAMRACRDAISSNSIPAFRRGSIPGVTFNEMKLQIKLGLPRPLQHLLDIEKIKSVFPYGAISNVEVVDGGLICSSGVHVEEMGDRNDDCYIVNAAVYIGY